MLPSLARPLALLSALATAGLGLALVAGAGPWSLDLIGPLGVHLQCDAAAAPFVLLNGLVVLAVELTLRGHLSPGGGFAAGVAGGTAIGLLLISGSVRIADRLYRHYRADLWEKAAVVAFVLVALLSLEGLAPGSGRFGAIDSGGWIPLLNVLVAVKVTLGSWAMVQLLVRYRGLL